MIIITCDHVSDREYIKCDRTKEVYKGPSYIIIYIYTIHILYM